MMYILSSVEESDDSADYHPKEGGTTLLLRRGHLSASAGSINTAGAQGRGPEGVPGGTIPS
ncbi:hypothetical protein D3C76_1562590 [compost metagenome]